MSTDSLQPVLALDWPAVVEFSVVWLCTFAALEFLGRSRGAGVVKGVLFVGVVLVLVVGVSDNFSRELARLHVLLTGLLSVVAIVGVAVFLPEIRQALVRVGESTLEAIDPSARRRPHADIGAAVAEASITLARQHIGAIIVIERGTSLEALAQGGVTVDAALSPRLLESIFWPSTPLHDLAVIIRDGRIAAANVELPMPPTGAVPPALGSRHRAAVGVTLDTDAVVVVVSEQTGTVRLAERGHLSDPLAREDVQRVLTRQLEADANPLTSTAARAREAEVAGHA